MATDLSEKTSILTSTPLSPVPLAPALPPKAVSTYKDHPDVKSKRVHLLVVIIIQILIGLVYLGAAITALVHYVHVYKAIGDNAKQDALEGAVVAAGVNLLFYLIFIIFVLKYSRFGILLFAWLGLFELVLIFAFLFVAVIGIMINQIKQHHFITGLIASGITVGVALLACLLLILMVVFSFQLAKRIKVHKAYTGI